jgi:hypothetical protein
MIGSAPAMLACGSRHAGAPTAAGTTTGTAPSAPASTQMTPTSSAAGTVSGGIDGGGGNYVGSEPEQIKSIFHGDHGFNLKETLSDIFQRIRDQILNKAAPPEIESIFSRMLGPKMGGDAVDIFKDIENSEYYLKPDGSCLETSPEGFKEASTQIGTVGSKICFSLQGLQRIPLQAIPFQLVALAVHEHAHHYGFKEADAIKAQKHVLETMQRRIFYARYMEAVGTSGEIDEAAKSLSLRIDAKYPDTLICKHLAQIYSQAIKLQDMAVKIDTEFETRMLVTALNFEYAINKKSLTGTKDLLIATNEALSFCGNDSLDSTPGGRSNVASGNRDKLRDQLSHIHELARAITLQELAKKDAE